MSEWTRVGQIVGAFGLKGELKVRLLTDFPERFAKGARFRLRNEWTEITGLRWHKERLLLRLEGVETIDQAEALQWEYLEVAAKDLPALEVDEYLTSDLIGLSVYTVDGRLLGTINEILPMPAHDVLVIGDLMIPAVKQFVKKIDLDNKRIEVELIEGMEANPNA